jgi:hypothetical protein
LSGRQLAFIFQEEWKMRDLVVEKASPFAFVIVVAWSIEGPRNLLRGILYDICLNACGFFAMLADFFQ